MTRLFTGRDRGVFGSKMSGQANRLSWLSWQLVFSPVTGNEVSNVFKVGGRKYIVVYVLNTVTEIHDVFGSIKRISKMAG